MSYINENNIYGTKPILEKHNIIKDDEDFYLNSEVTSSCCNDKENNFSNRIVQPTCGCIPEPPKCGCGHTQPTCGYPLVPPIDICDECIPVNKCCTSQNCKFDYCKSKCICTYMDVLYDEEVANGPTLFNVFSASIPNYLLTSEFFQTPGCCNGCVVDSTSSFVVESVNVTLKSFAYTGTTLPIESTTIPSISPSSILVNGLPVLSVSQNNSGYSTIVDPAVLNPTCNCHDKGTNGNVLIQNLSGFNYTAKYVFCGKVTTNGTTCKFKIVAQNNTIPDLVNAPLSFVAPKICIPEVTPPEVLNLNMQFGATGQIVNPVVTAIGGPAPAPVTLAVSGNLMLNTKASLQVTKNTKVYIQGMLS